MSNQQRQVLGFIIVIIVAAMLVATISYADTYGAWVWGIPAAILGGVGIAAVRYPPLRTGLGEILTSVSVYFSEPTRTKRRTAIPLSIQRQVWRRANDTCEIPECTRFGRLEFHHIDNNPTNHQPDNVIHLCPNHHDMATRGRFTKEELVVFTTTGGHELAQRARRRPRHDYTRKRY